MFTVVTWFCVFFFNFPDKLRYSATKNHATVICYFSWEMVDGQHMPDNAS